jgi:hypothetical protein
MMNPLVQQDDFFKGLISLEDKFPEKTLTHRGLLLSDKSISVNYVYAGIYLR